MIPAARLSARPLPTGGWRSLGVVVLLGALAALASSLTSVPRAAAYEPDSTDPSGTKALVMLLESFGAEVDVVAGGPPPDAQVALMLSNVIAREDGPAVMRWVEGGGRLIVADPYSTLAPPPETRSSPFATTSGRLRKGRCEIPALDQLAELDVGPSYSRFEVPATMQGCFDEGRGAFVVAGPRGEGWLVFLGGADQFTNSLLAAADNAGLAVALLAPQEGTRVAILDPSGGVPSDRSLFDALPRGFWLAVTQLAVAFGVYGWFRGRRLGPVIVEPQPVQIEGSELVSAVGNLAQLSRRPDRTAAVLRRALHRELAERLGLGRDATPAVVAEVTAARTGIDRDRIAAVLAGPAVADDAQLVALAGEIDRIRKEVLHGH
ncbi:DUF4350 domain-containing protein [Rhabdothermincola sediminis]|uniref:DUF4350 domain-containing protein n=1 Tax=Rhabdothermincola sediminis TaxID=2751370 RepID=UPI001AA01F08|nr:DUF4350 domain-containing protein [Rhabdothermincola sediminis]